MSGQVKSSTEERGLATMDTEWDMWAHDYHGQHQRSYQHIGEKWWVEIHGLPDPVVAVRVTEVETDSPDGTHWGWIDAGKESGPPCMIWAHRGAFDMQFPYGTEAEQERGKGRVVRLRITAREDSEP
jgi:hypothetical protein